MGKFFNLWLLGLLFQIVSSEIHASDYVVNYGYEYGSFYFQNGVSANNAYAAYWLSTQTEPQLKLAVARGYNNIDVKSHLGALFVGSRQSPYELSVSEGFVITGYSVVGKALSFEQTFTPSEGGEPVIFNSSEESTVVVDNLRTESTSFTLTGANTGLEIISFEIYVDVDAERTADLAAHYNAALASLESGNKYWISTLYSLDSLDAKRFYLDSEGALTDDFTKANAFILTSTTATSSFRPIGWKAEGISFSSPYIERGYLTNVNHIMTNVAQDRDDWETQVYLKGDNHYAIRSTNVNSAEYFANTYWAVTDVNMDSIPEANYSEERTYVWDVIPYDSVKEASLLLAAMAEEYRGIQIEKCDLTLLSQYNTLLKNAIEISNSDFDSNNHNEECVALLPELKTAFNAVQASVESYKNYQLQVDKVMNAANSCLIPDSPLAIELMSMATQLQDNIDLGAAQDSDFKNVDSLITEKRNYWSCHLTEADKEPLYSLVEQVPMAVLWDLDAEELSLDGVTIAEGTVTGIDLSGKGLFGEFPLSVLLEMPHLAHINLSNNGVSSCDVEWNSDDVTVNLHNQNLLDVIEFNLSTCSDATIPSQLSPILLYENGKLTSNYSVCAQGNSWTLGINNSNEDGKMVFEPGYPFVYDGESGDEVTFTSMGGDASGSTFSMQISFDQGDASFDGAIDIADLQMMINYIFNMLQTGDMFNLAAADLWNDNKIKVQDIVKEVDLLLGQTAEEAESRGLNQVARLPLHLLSHHSGAQARLGFVDGQLQIESNHPVAAIHLVLNAASDIDWSLLRSLGFSVSSRTQGNDVHFIAYSLSGAEIPMGTTVIATTDDDAAQIRSARITDSAAKYIDVELNSHELTNVGTVSERVKSDSSDYYDLQGRAISSPTRRGVYIHKQKKIVVR